MADKLDRRVRYEEDAKKMTDRDLMEFTFVEMRDLSHHVQKEINGKVRKIWAERAWLIMTGKVVMGLAGLAGVILGLFKVL